MEAMSQSFSRSASSQLAVSELAMKPFQFQRHLQSQVLHSAISQTMTYVRIEHPKTVPKFRRAEIEFRRTTK
eukprot:549651-Amphidinium_carterae.1